MTGKQLRVLRNRLGLTQVDFGARIKVTGNSIARMERGEVVITEPMALLITYVAREGRVGKVDDTWSGGRNLAPESAKRLGATDSKSKGRQGARKNLVQRGRRSRLPKKSD